jgi:hypothetical protein
MLVVAIASGSAVVAISLGIAFGVVRALPLLMMARVRTPAALRQVHEVLAAYERPADVAARCVGAAALAAVVTLAAFGVVS